MVAVEWVLIGQYFFFFKKKQFSFPPPFSFLLNCIQQPPFIHHRTKWESEFRTTDSVPMVYLTLTIPFVLTTLDSKSHCSQLDRNVDVHRQVPPGSNLLGSDLERSVRPRVHNPPFGSIQRAEPVECVLRMLRRCEPVDFKRPGA